MQGKFSIFFHHGSLNVIGDKFRFVRSKLKSRETFCRSAVKFPSSLVKRLRRIGMETRLKGYTYFEIERDFFNKLDVLIDGDFKFGVLLLVFVRFLGGDTGNLYRNVFL
jgi:hypothetical protein